MNKEEWTKKNSNKKNTYQNKKYWAYKPVLNQKNEIKEYTFYGMLRDKLINAVSGIIRWLSGILVS